MAHRSPLKVILAVLMSLVLIVVMLISVAGPFSERNVYAQEDNRSIPSLRLASNQPGVIEVSWDSPAESPQEYRVVWALASESFPNRDVANSNAFPTGTSYTISGLDPGIEYQVKVRARYNDGTGDWSPVERIVAYGEATATPTPTTETEPPPADTATPTPTPTPTAETVPPRDDAPPP